jgi:ApbE superfamily uncharacterized protein (UPF0280 family)
MKGKKARQNPNDYQERFYRTSERSGLMSSTVRLMETDLHILADRMVEDRALQLVTALRSQLEQYIAKVPLFASSLVPLPEDTAAHLMVQEMLVAARLAGVGPMAAVAGAIAEYVGTSLLADGVGEVIVENGGDLFIARAQHCITAVYAGESPLSGKVGLQLQAEQMPCGVCCSSGSIGHSLSLGVSDAVVVLAKSTPLADAAATRIGNEVGPADDGVNRALRVAQEIKSIDGVLIIRGEQLGAWGAVELVPL